MKESDMQTIFGRYIRTIKPKRSAVFELKISKGKSLPFNALKDHQIAALQGVTELGFYHKLIDPPVFANMETRFNAPRPFDCLYLKGIEAFVVIWFYHERQPKKFIFIPISRFLDERDNSDRKSLTEERAKEIGTEILI